MAPHGARDPMRTTTVCTSCNPSLDVTTEAGEASIVTPQRPSSPEGAYRPLDGGRAAAICHPPAPRPTRESAVKRVRPWRHSRMIRSRSAPAARIAASQGGGFPRTRGPISTAMVPWFPVRRRAPQPTTSAAGRTCTPPTRQPTACRGAVRGSPCRGEGRRQPHPNVVRKVVLPVAENGDATTRCVSMTAGSPQAFSDGAHRRQGPPLRSGPGGRPAAALDPGSAP